MAPYTPLDLSEEQRKAVEGNLGNLDQINVLLNRLMPGFTDTIKQQGDNISDWSRGELSDATRAEITRSNAFKSLGSFGYGSPGLRLSREARELGLASEGQQTKGLNALQQWSKIAGEAYSPYLLNTAEQAGVTAANNAGEQATKQYGFNIEAGADPSAAGVFNTSVAANQQMQSSLQQSGGAFANSQKRWQYDPQSNTWKQSGSGWG